MMLGHPRAGSLEAVGVSSPGLGPVLHQPLQAGPGGPADRVFRAQAAMERQGGLCLQEKLPHWPRRQPCSARRGSCWPGSRAALGLDAHAAAQAVHLMDERRKEKGGREESVPL